MDLHQKSIKREDPLWRILDDSKVLSKEELELTVPSKKVEEVFQWFKDHFVNNTLEKYLASCPIVIIRGPTGCGKTSTLKYIARELNIPIKQYSETMDGISSRDELVLQGDIKPLRLSAMRFEHFIIQSIRYNYLNLGDGDSDDDDVEMFAEEGSEFDDDSDIEDKPPPEPDMAKIIIHIDTPLSFAKTQEILIQTLKKLIKIIRDISPRLKRRVAIVFETLENECELLTSRPRSALNIRSFKFNSVTKKNMKKLIESIIKDLKDVSFDNVDQLAEDSDGDIRACINTLQLICNKPANLDVCKQINYKSYHKSEQANKKQKLTETVRYIQLKPGLMRDNTRSVILFHVLGKIFYQKRYYPVTNGKVRRMKESNSIVRPYQTENSTEYLADLLDVGPNQLITWLHHHYPSYCYDENIEKAALFLENLATTDTTSIASINSSQFYEVHSSFDQLQTHLAINSTVFSLYEDQSVTSKKDRKNDGTVVLRSSVETYPPTAIEGYKKPTFMNLYNLIQDYNALLRLCRVKLTKLGPGINDLDKVLLDFVPYLCQISNNLKIMETKAPKIRAQQYQDADFNQLFNDELTKELFEKLGTLNEKPDSDLEVKHDELKDLIDKVESCEVREQMMLRSITNLNLSHN